MLPWHIKGSSAPGMGLTAECLAGICAYLAEGGGLGGSQRPITQITSFANHDHAEPNFRGHYWSIGHRQRRPVGRRRTRGTAPVATIGESGAVPFFTCVFFTLFLAAVMVVTPLFQS